MTNEELSRLKQEIVQHTISRSHAIYGAVATIAVSLALTFGAYLTTIADIRKQIALNEKDVDAKISAIRLEREQQYVKKEEFTKLDDKLSAVINSLSRMEGQLQVAGQKGGSR